MRGRRWVFAGVLTLAAVELVAAARSYRSIIAPEDWARAAERAAEVPEGEPVLLAQAWLGERARQEVAATRRWSSLAPPDLWGRARIHVLGLRPWSEDLTRALEGRAPPALVEEVDLGGLTWATYVFTEPQRVAFDLVRDDPDRVEIDGVPCRGRAPIWRCREGGQVALRTAEVGFRPRRCLSLAVTDGARVTLSAKLDVATPATVRGHVGFADFNARLRSDAPAQVALAVDGAERGRFVATDAQGWLPFTAPLGPGAHRLELHVTVPAAGTWQRGGYSQRTRHEPCLELRVIEPAPGAAPPTEAGT